ncbi:hypothetical protein L202_01879 [Cryptococcus amylolentus CBS 6039]|uniref:Uncharacterized protein n=1 Tax=Cryptococcus amylolentus CBS 6039 TaxID=1295533 RepID=A0A1E3HYN7_9TREE|nr:hypothetical protein L202_01879 [Cryptococcus amylolentus CBS 6039]ODN81450.1 hypothetical protein L202_01879 [Cryptococcus amylolentus CBS 6039]
MVLLVGWWVVMQGDMKRYRPICLLFLPYVLVRWRWCTAPYGSRVFGVAPADASAPADAASADSAHADASAPDNAASADSAHADASAPNDAASADSAHVDASAPADAAPDPAPAQVPPEIKALMDSKDALLNSKDALLDSKDALLASQAEIISQLREELKAAKLRDEQEASTAPPSFAYWDLPFYSDIVSQVIGRV